MLTGSSTALDLSLCLPNPQHDGRSESATYGIGSLHEGPSNEPSSQSARSTAGFQSSRRADPATRACVQESTPMDCEVTEVSPHGSGVEQQRPIPRGYMEAHNSGEDPANPSAGPTGRGVSREMSGDEWNGTLYLNGVCAHARAHADETVRNPYAHSFVKCQSALHSRRKLSAWPNHLQLEPVFDTQVNNFDIQKWMHETRAPVVRLSCRDGTDKRQFCQLVGILRSGHGVSRQSG